MSFVESATLRVNDQSSAALKEINAALKKMEASAKKLSRAFGSMKPLNLSSSLGEVKKLNTALNNLGKKKIVAKVSADTTAARTSINTLKAKPLTVSVRADTRYAKAALTSLKAKPLSFTVTANTKTAQGRIDRLHAKGITIKVDALTAQAQTKINALKAKAVNVKVTATTAAAQKTITALRATPVVVPVTANVAQAVNSIKTLGKPITIKINADTASFSSFLKGIFGSLASEIKQNLTQAVVQGVRNGIKEGFAQADTAATKIRLQQNDAATDAAISQGTTAFIQENRTKTTSRTGDLSRVEAEKITSEISTTLNADPVAIAAALRQLQGIIKQQVGLGQDRDAAIASAFEFIKAAEASSNIKDPKTGQFDPVKFGAFFDTLRQTAPEVGQEFTGRLVRQAIKYMRGSKSGISGEQLATIILLNEESGSTASVGTNMLIKMLSGDQQSKKSMRFLNKLGLNELELKDTGAVGKNKTQELVSAGIKDEEMLRENTPMWVREYLIPAMRAQGLDPTNKIDRAKFIGDLGGTTTAQDVVGQLIGRAADLEVTLKKIMDRDPSTAAVDKNTEESGMLALTGAGAQVTSLLGEIATSFNVILIPALNNVSSALQGIGEFIQGPEGKPDPLKSTAVVAGGVLGTLGTLFAGFKAFQALTGTSANTVALGANTAATAANTAALLGAAAGATTATTTAAAAAAGTTLMGKVKGFISTGLKAAGAAGATILGLELLKGFDPEGNLGGFTKNFDEWIKSQTGFDPSKDFDPNKIAQTTMDALSKPGIIDDIGAAIKRAMTATPEDNKLTPGINRVTATDNKPLPVSVVNAVADAKQTAAMQSKSGVAQTVFPGKVADDLGVGQVITTATDNGASNITAAANSGATGITSAGMAAASSIATSVVNGGTSLAAGVISGANTAAGILAAAISGAAANVHVNVQQNTKPLNTGLSSLPGGVR